MKRREFLTLAGGAVALAPLVAQAQQRAMPKIGFLGIEFHSVVVAEVRRGLSESGYSEGQNLAIEYRWAEGRMDRLPALAADLVRTRVAVIIADASPAAAAAKAATATVPIVFNTGADPVAAGFVESLNRPGGNLTGATILLAEIVPKHFELLREMLPAAKTVAFLYNPSNRTIAGPITKGAQEAAGSLGFKIDTLQASTEREIDNAYARLDQMHPDGLVIGPDVYFTARSKRLAALSLQHSVPAIYHERSFAEAGGLMSYGVNVGDAYRLLGVYAARILKGEKPADLPVQRATKVELVVNLKTAKILGVTVPLPLSGRADEIIE